jgi:hypothetical protein
MLPLIIIPVLTLLKPNADADEEVSQKFYAKLGRIQKNFTWA